MSLLSLWQSNPAAITELTIEQVVAVAGNGKLLDHSDCSKEIRSFFSQVDTDRLASYAGQCLASSFPKSGIVLQDIVNELGRRLEYTVTNGRYQGTTSKVGFDGIWVSPEKSAIVVEVKTTDAYRISLDVIARYRDRLIAANTIVAPASVLIVVGREDTGELEAQVRGSRHAWDMRLISIDALVDLVRTKESTDSGISGTKIRSVLIPMEYTRLDALVEVMFTTTKDAESAADNEQLTEVPDSEPTSGGAWEFTAPEIIRAKRETIIAALGARDGVKLIKKGRATYWDAGHKYRIACTLSKRYTKKGATPYWYAYHPSWDEFLKQGDPGWFVLGCVDLDEAFAVPVEVIHAHLPELNTSTAPDGGQYWHIKLIEPTPGQYALQLPNSGGSMSLADYRISIRPLSAATVT